MVLNVDTIKCLKVVKSDRTAIKREKKVTVWYWIKWWK
jgi:hypothetical protein